MTLSCRICGASLKPHEEREGFCDKCLSEQRVTVELSGPPQEEALPKLERPSDSSGEAARREADWEAFKARSGFDRLAAGRPRTPGNLFEGESS